LTAHSCPTGRDNPAIVHLTHCRYPPLGERPFLAGRYNAPGSSRGNLYIRLFLRCM
jgi:hypothetical protein